MKSSTQLHRPNKWGNSGNSRALIVLRALWLSRFISLPSPTRVPGSPRPTLLAPVIPASHAAQVMGPVPTPCPGVHSQPHTPLHGQLAPEVLPLLQPRAGRFALCLWIPTAWRLWLEQSQP